MNNKVGLTFLCLVAVFLVRCSIGPVAGGSDNPDFVVLGSVQDNMGKPAKNTVVSIYSETYNPLTDARPAAYMTDTTGADGVYRLYVPEKGGYIMMAVNHLNGTRSLVTGISIEEDTSDVPAATLAAPGRIVLPHSEISANSGYVYVPGTNIVVPINETSDTIVLDSVPSGVFPVLAYASKENTNPVPLRYEVTVEPQKSTVVWNSSWKYSRKVFFNTTENGAGVVSDVVHFPVLVRLNSRNFDFSQAQQNGSDLRFEKNDKSSLPYEIERWDTVAMNAEVWVKIDTIFGDDSTQNIVMFWGNSDAKASADGFVVFDTTEKFIGVWHMNGVLESGKFSFEDQTINAHHAIAFGGMAASNSVDGMVGKGLSFDGIDDYLDAGNVSVPGTYSIGFWVMPDTLGNYQRFICKDSSYTLWYDKDSASIRMEHFTTATWWRGMLQDGGTRVPMILGDWMYITGTYDGNVVRLYENGILASVSKEITIPPNTASTSLRIGKSIDSFVNGVMDEIRIEGAARSADWIKLCYMNQRIDDKLIKIK